MNIAHVKQCTTQEKRIKGERWVGGLGGPIQCESYEHFCKMCDSIRKWMICESPQGFGLSRGPVTYDWLKVLYGAETTDKYWRRRQREAEIEDEIWDREHGIPTQTNHLL